MKNLPLLIGTLVGTVLLVVGVVWFLSRSTTPQAVDPASLVPENAHRKGKADAKVTIVEFSDFQCPACRAVQPLVKSVADKYPDQVSVVYRHFPLTIHPYAPLAAQAAEVAGEQNKFWEYHDILFERQPEWSELKSTEEVKQKFADYAQELGIDKASFLERIDTDYIKQLVTRDVTAGGSLRIQSTPTLYVNGQPTAAPQLLSTVESRINN